MSSETSFHALWKRLSPDSHVGQSISLGVILILFLALINAVFILHRFPWDSQIVQYFLAHPVSLGTFRFFNGVTQLGEGYFGFMLCCILLVLGILFQQWLWECLIVVFCSTWTMLLIEGLKDLFHRHRPPGAEKVLHHLTYSFPSGHATISVCLYGLIGILIARHVPQPHRGLCLGAFLILIILIGLSRIILGVHYLSDVLGGYLFGLFNVFLWLWIYDTGPKSQDERSSSA